MRHVNWLSSVNLLLFRLLRLERAWHVRTSHVPRLASGLSLWARGGPATQWHTARQHWVDRHAPYGPVLVLNSSPLRWAKSASGTSNDYSSLDPPGSRVYRES